MTKEMIRKLIFIILLITFCVVLILPTIGSKKMEIKLADTATTEDIEAVKQRFSGSGYSLKIDDKKITVAGRNITDAVMNEMKVLNGVSDVKILKHWAETVFLAKKINLGLDLQGGMHLVLKADFEGTEKKLGRELSEKDKNEITQQALELIRSRIDKFGVSEPQIRPRGNEAIEIGLPGIKDPAGVKKAIGTTGSLEYRLVDDNYTGLANAWLKENFKDKELPSDPVELKSLLLKISEGIKLPDNLEALFSYKRVKDKGIIVPDYPIVLLKEISLKGTDIQEAMVEKDEYNQVVVAFKTTSDGASKFAEATSEKNHGKKLAIVLDDKVRNAPNIKDTIGSGSGTISGGFSFEEAQTLARVIKEGALPVNLRIIEERSVGPSLGQDSIEAGIKSFIVGLGAIIIFMIIYYKWAGVIANLGLILNFIFMMAVLSLLGYTLTLPGIAGFVLTMGMSVDANVIIYERIKEELKRGKSVRFAISAGFDKGFWTIFDSNLTTLLAAFILYEFGTGPIKGFAVSLFVGLLASMFVALYITRFTYELLSLDKKKTKLSI